MRRFHLQTRPAPRVCGAAHRCTAQKWGMSSALPPRAAYARIAAMTPIQPRRMPAAPAPVARVRERSPEVAG